MGFWKTLGKIGAIAAPIVAAPFTGGASLAAIGALSGAAGGALNGGGWKGTLLGAGIGGATAGIGGGAGSAAKGASKVGFGNIAKSVLTDPNVLSSIGRTIGAGTDQAAQNRGAETEAQLFRDQIAMQAQRDHESELVRRAQLEMEQKGFDTKFREDAGNSAIRASAIQNWKPAARPDGVANISFAGAPGEGGMQAAKEMERQALIRQLQGGNLTAPPTLDPKYNVSAVKQAGTMEKIGGFLSPAFSIGGAIAAGAQGLSRKPKFIGDVDPNAPMHA